MQKKEKQENRTSVEKSQMRNNIKIYSAYALLGPEKHAKTFQISFNQIVWLTKDTNKSWTFLRIA